MAMSPLEGELVNTVLYCDPRQVIYRLLAFKSSTINKRKKNAEFYVVSTSMGI